MPNETHEVSPPLPDKRLEYLLQYHHSLSIQLAGITTFSHAAMDHLKRLEQEIDELLGLTARD